MENSLFNDFLNVISTKIKEYKRNIKDFSFDNHDKVVISDLIRKIKNDKNVFLDLDKEQLLLLIKNYLVENNVISIQEIKDYFENDFELLYEISSGINQGLDLSFDEDDNKKISKLVDYLEMCLVQIEEQRDKYNERKKIYEDGSSKYIRLYDKVRSLGGLEYITKDEMDLIYELISDKDFTYYREISKFIYSFNKKVQVNIDMQTRHLFDDELVEEDDDKYLLDEDLLEKLFSDYGFVLKGMPSNIYEALRRCDTSKIKKIFEYISNTPEYEFLKSFGSEHYFILDENGDQRKITVTSKLRKRQFAVLYQILRYSSVEILDYLKANNDVNNLRNILLNVKGVVKHIPKKLGDGGGIVPPGGVPKDDDDIKITGTFEYYNSNSRELKKLGKENGIDYLSIALQCDAYSNSLGLNPDRFSRNIAILKQYGFDFKIYNNKSLNQLPWLSSLCIDSNILLNRIDLLIENGVRDGKKDESFAYFLKYPSVLSYQSNLVPAIVYGSYSDSLDFYSNGYLKEKRREVIEKDADYYTELLDRKELSEFRSEIPYKYHLLANMSYDEIDLNYSDEYVDKMKDFIIRDEQNLLNGLAYNINGVIVSLPKFLRIWKKIMLNYSNDCDLDKLCVFALSYGSYYTKEELDNIRTSLSGMRFD